MVLAGDGGQRSYSFVSHLARDTGWQWHRSVMGRYDSQISACARCNQKAREVSNTRRIYYGGGEGQCCAGTPAATRTLGFIGSFGTFGTSAGF